MRTVLLLFFAILAIEARSIQEKCEVSIDYKNGDLNDPQPLILTDNDDPKFLLPNDQKFLTISSNTSIILSCPGDRNSLPKFNKKFVEAVCLKGKEFLVDSKIYDFGDFKCKTIPKETINKITSKCLDKHQRYDIGFYHGKHFLKQLEICRDQKTYRTFYTKYTIVKEIEGFQSSFPRPSWRYGSYYKPYNMNQIYKASSQLRSFEKLLGSAELAQKYVRSGEQFLNRGHLAAKADFVYGSQQSATFWLMNAEPQWASFNAGNWLRVEQAVQTYAAEHKVDLDIYTGVHGVTSLVDVNGDKQPLYLHTDGDDQAFPVPRFFWKIMHDTKNKRALAFVGLNEPYAEDITKDMYICPDIRDEKIDSWLGWDPTNIERGVSYLCSVEELRKVVPAVPSLEEIGVISLTGN